jgi:hypothetical protein
MEKHKIIYLVVEDDEGKPAYNDEIYWSSTRVNDSDLVYVLKEPDSAQVDQLTIQDYAEQVKTHRLLSDAKDNGFN